MKVAIVGKYPLNAIDKIKRLIANNIEIFEVDTLEKLEDLKDADCIVLRGFKINEKKICQIPNLKFIQRWGAGFDTVDIEAAGKRNIYVSNLPGVNAYAVSEMVITMILALYKNLINHHNSLVKGNWTRDSYNERTYTLKNKLVGLIGFGNIGKQVCKLVQSFGASVQYYDIYRLQSSEEKEFNVKYVELIDLFKTSDIISVHLPLTDNTKGIIDKDELKLMKNTAIIINTSRGGIINENALYESLANNEILGAGLDCFCSEPIDPDNPLLKLENVVLTPHVGGASIDLSDEMAIHVARNIMRFNNNQEPLYIVNKSYIKLDN